MREVIDCIKARQFIADTAARRQRNNLANIDASRRAWYKSALCIAG
ncbi:hypothetical protein [Chromatium okenii]|nr:hypothetical protein [Chromatium okenii]